MKKIFWFSLALFLIVILILLLLFFWPSKEEWKNVRITYSAGESRFPAMVWNGSGYGIVWNDRRNGDHEVFFALVDENGRKLTDDVNISGDSGSVRAHMHPRIAWTGSEYGIVWGDSGNPCYLNFVRLDANGNRRGDIIRMISDTHYTCPRDVSINWNGLTYGVLFRWKQYGRDDLNYYIGLNGLGERVTSVVPISPGSTWLSYPLMAWSGSEYGVVWVDTGGPYRNGLLFTTIDAHGWQQTPGVRINSTATPDVVVPIPDFPSIVWNNSDLKYGIAWDEIRAGDGGRIYFTRVDRDSNEEGDEISITPGGVDGDYFRAPSIAWADSESEYGIAWYQGNIDEKGVDALKFARLDSAGALKDEAVQISDAVISGIATTTGHARNPAVVWNGSKYGVAWDDTRDLNTGEEIYFAVSSFRRSVADIFKEIKEFLIDLF